MVSKLNISSIASYKGARIFDCLDCHYWQQSLARQQYPTILLKPAVFGRVLQALNARTLKVMTNQNGHQHNCQL